MIRHKKIGEVEDEGIEDDNEDDNDNDEDDDDDREITMIRGIA